MDRDEFFKKLTTNWENILTVVRNTDTCIGCDAPCMDVCPTDAVVQFDGGRTTIRNEWCTVSGGCVAACPHDNITYADAFGRE